MRKIITIIFVMTIFQLSIENCLAQSPNAISYQGIARNTSGAILGLKAISLRFSLHDVSADGTVVYSETHSTNTTALGLFTLNIGAGSSVIGTFDAVNWGSGAKFLQVEMDANGGLNYVDMGTTQMMSVPFALYAKTAGSALGSVNYAGTWNASSNDPFLESRKGTKGFYYVVTNAGSSSIDGISDWDVNDWVIYNGTKWEKVDNSEAPIVGKVNKSGDTMTGNLILNADPTVALGAATKQYVDTGDAALQTQINTKVSKSGDTMTGDLILHSSPTTALGAATKQYVDDSLAPVQGQFANMIDSFINKTDDGVTIYKPSGTAFKRFGIGDTAPEAPLGIKGEVGADDKMIAFASNDGSNKWNINLNPTSGNIPGFSIDDSSSGTSMSRLFIQESTGYVGLGTTNPDQKLHIQDSVEGGSVGVVIQNAASAKNKGYKLSHYFETGDKPTADQFTISEIPNESTGGSSPLERLTILSGGNVGINESIPDTKLHVSRPASDLSSDIDLIPGTGIVVIGPIIGNNLGMDSHQIQARTGEYVGGSTTLGFTASALGLQPRGGGILIHGDSSVASDKVIITGDGKVGLGKTPVEKIDIDGAIKIGTTENNNEGTIRYTGTDFEGQKQGNWVSLTHGSVWEKVDNTNSIYFNATNPKVGIGTATPTSALHVSNTENVTSSSSTMTIDTDATTNSISSSDNRIGLEIKNTGTWSSTADAKNVGIYVSDISGQTSKESNIAAVLNGNVVIGNVNSSKVIGTNGTNVLAIQNGSVPTVAPGSTTAGGIQIFSDAISSDGATPPVSTFHVMNGNGDVIKLSKQDAITPSSATAANSGDASTDALINNLRQRITDLENVLKALGLLTP